MGDEILIYSKNEIQSKLQQQFLLRVLSRPGKYNLYQDMRLRT